MKKLLFILFFTIFALSAYSQVPTKLPNAWLDSVKGMNQAGVRDSTINIIDSVYLRCLPDSGVLFIANNKKIASDSADFKYSEATNTLSVDTGRFDGVYINGVLVSSAITLQQVNGIVDLAKEFGADTTGATDISVPLRRALATNRGIFFRQGNYRLDSTVIFPDSCFIFGEGNKTNIILTRNVAGFRPHARSTFRDLTFRGTKNLGGTLAQDAIVCDSLQRQILIDNCNFHAIAGSAVLIQGTSDENIISGCHMDSCGFGVETTTTGEYNLINNCIISFGTRGVSMNAGNTSITGGIIYYNGDGIIITGGSNNGHSVANGVMINHNTNAVTCTGNNLGYLFDGCMFYQGNVSITGSTGVKFTDCDISITSLSCSTSVNVAFMDCNVYTFGSVSADTSRIYVNGFSQNYGTVWDIKASDQGTYKVDSGKFKFNTIGDVDFVVATSNIERLKVDDTTGSVRVYADLSVDSAIYETGIKTITAAAYTISRGDNMILCDATGGAITINLPPVASMLGRILNIKKTNAANTVTVDGDGGETIDGATTNVLSTQWSSITIICDGTAWFIK